MPLDRLPDRVGLVGREVIPVVLEVDALAAVHQCFRYGAVEAEVPHAGVVVVGLPTGYAWKKCVHQHELFGLGRELRGVGVGDHESDIVPYDGRLLYIERLCEVMDAASRPLHADMA
jgi:hypothetical protein